jgi:ribosomal protein S18 acetylase RimI-like enzyme
VVVDEKYRQQGLGTKLINKLLTKAKEQGVFAVELTSNPKRKIARKLYQKLGFKLLETGVFRLEIIS